MFSTEVIKNIGYYVYRLIDPRSGETFYVGRGYGNRVFQHVKNELKAKDFENGQIAESGKLNQIRSIRNEGLGVIHIIHRHGMDELTAIEVEAAMIDAYAGLTNQISGEGSNERGVMHHRQVEEAYNAPELVPKHKLLVININRSFEDGERTLYDAVRFAWRISADNANKCDYVLANVKGVIKGAFEADEWLDVTIDNFPSREPSEGRRGFHGRIAPKEIQDLYVGKRVPADFVKKGASNPVRYLGLD